MSTLRTVLIGGAVVVGAFVIYELVSPAAKAKPSTSLLNGNPDSFVGLGASAASLFRGIFSSNSAQPGSTAVSGGSYTGPWSGSAPGYVFAGPSNFSTSAPYETGASPYTPYAPGASAPGPFAPNYGGDVGGGNDPVFV